MLLPSVDVEPLGLARPMAFAWAADRALSTAAALASSSKSRALRHIMYCSAEPNSWPSTRKVAGNHWLKNDWSTTPSRRRHIDLRLPGALGQHHLLPAPVPHVSAGRVRLAVALMSQVLGQLLVQSGFQQRLGQLLQQPLRAGQDLRESCKTVGERTLAEQLDDASIRYIYRLPRHSHPVGASARTVWQLSRNG